MEEFGIVNCSLSSQEKSSLMRPSGLKLKEDKDRLENKFSNSSRFSMESLVKYLILHTSVVPPEGLGPALRSRPRGAGINAVLVGIQLS